MDPERWQKVKQIYQSALEVAPAGREIFLRDKCTGDEALLQEVRSLLNQESQSPLDSPALDGAARALAQEQSSKDQPDLVGQTLQHYRIQEKIGEGGMGVVYRARDEHLKRDVAIKVLPPELVVDSERKKRFVQEARAASALSHPNIVTIHDIASDAGRDFIVMEYVAGKTLAQKIGRKGMKLGDALKCAIQIADALAAAHAAGIVHRDLKPANILVTESGQVKVLDFGLAKLTQPLNGEGADSSSVALSTEEGRIMGTAAYMSPEQAEGKAVDARSDIFSFGSVLYELVTGRRAFQGNSVVSIVAEILKSEPAPLNGGNSHDLEMIITRCLRKDPVRRFQHMDDIKVALEDLMRDSEPGKLKNADSVPPRPRRRYPMWTLAAALMILAGVSVFLYIRRKSKEAPSVSVVPLTSYQGAQQSPSFSPDGSRVAFSWNGDKGDNFDIYIKPLSQGPARRLTSDPSPDSNPKWSPDGNWIAFYRNGFVYLISPEGGPERKMTEGRPFSWTPDGRFLAVHDGEIGKVQFTMRLISAETGEKSDALTAPPPQSSGDSRPAISPNGKNLAFHRYIGGVAGFITDIYILPLGDGRPGGAAWRLCSANDHYDQGEVTWTPDGRELIFSSVRSGRRSLWRIAVTPGAEAQRIPGTDDAFGATISTSRPSRLVYARTLSIDNIWRMQTAGDGEVAGAPERVVATMGLEWDPQYSPDGNRIAFRSDRSGFVEIMVCNNDGSNPVPLTSFKGSRYAGAPRWSPDGLRIAFDSQGPDGVSLFVVDAQGGACSPLTQGGRDIRPSWSRDGRWIYFGSNRSGTSQIWKSAPDGKDVQQVTREGGFEAFESPNGKTLFFTRGGFYTPGLWSMPVEGGREAALPLLSSVYPGHWAVADRGIYFIDFYDGPPEKPAPVKLFVFQSRQVSKVGAIEKIKASGRNSFTVTRDGRWMAWRQTDRFESNLMLIENFR